jgi:hypothetical protein
MSEIELTIFYTANLKNNYLYFFAIIHELFFIE